MDAKLIEQCNEIQALDEAMQISSVNYLWDKFTEVYGRLKSVNAFTNWAFDTIEMVLNIVVKSSPVAKLVRRPISNLDKTLCQSIDFVEFKMPVIKKNPRDIIKSTKTLVIQQLKLAVQIFIDLKREIKNRVRIMILHTYYKVHYLRIYTWQQADKVMSSETGMNILRIVDNTTEMAELMLNKYLPALDDESFNDSDDECSEDARLHHTTVKLGEFSNRATRRIYFAFMERLQHMYKIEILILILHALIMIQVIKYMESILSSILRIVNDCLTSH